MNNCPFSSVQGRLRGLFRRKPDPEKKLAAAVAALDAHALRTWREGHHLFFVLIQMTILELRQFMEADQVSNLDAAKLHLDRASVLMLGSGAAMRLAGDVNQESYISAVLPSMERVRPRFSGSESHDHAVLIEVYREMGPLAAALPAELRGSYARFLNSVRTAIGAHVYVCAFHRGKARVSSGSASGTRLTGVETLTRIGAHWISVLTSRRGTRGTMRP